MELPAHCGRYELIEYLGGGIAEVYRARDTVINRVVAVKMLRPDRASDSESRARFLREAKMAGNVVHDNIIHTYDFGESDGRPFIVMEFLHGRNLREAMNRNEVGDFDHRLQIALGIACAFEHVHSLGIIHRDIKPENINIDALGKVKLMDFGIAKSRDLDLTRKGFTLGTPSYMAPEQVTGQTVSPSVDIYAFGILLFEIFSGAKPIQAPSVSEVFQKILNEPIDMEPLVKSGVDRPVVDLVRRLTAKKPEERPGSFQEVVKEIESLSSSAAAPESTPPVPPRRVVVKKPAPWLLPIAALGTLVIIAGFYFGLTSGPEPPALAPVTPAGMVLVPAGDFLFGAGDSKEHLPDYWIDRTEVSVAAFAKFASETGRPAPDGPPDSPATRVTIDDARAYATWAGKRLPTPREWEKAARGVAGNMYPWGNDPASSLANVAGNPAADGRLMPVDSLPHGASAYGVLHMLGNASELALDFVQPSPDDLERFALLLAPPPTVEESWCVVRGGSVKQPLREDASYREEAIPARFSSEFIGFRCVKDRVAE